MRRPSKNPGRQKCTQLRSDLDLIDELAKVSQLSDCVDDLDRMVPRTNASAGDQTYDY